MDKRYTELAVELVKALQARFVNGLEELTGVKFGQSAWLRDQGRYGGGDRFGAADGDVFNQASVNVSHIHYDDLPEKALASASAISTIIHPVNPHAPSVHMHFSWTEMKGGKGYWRMMADLNPSIVYEEDKAAFEKALAEAAGEEFEAGVVQGEKYFYIPVLGRHRGVAHFYLEAYNSGDFATDLELARTIGEGAIASYLSIVGNALAMRGEVSPMDRDAQLAYHTLYFFQVLTLDRGTTSGLLVHDQNDLGIMGSLPARVDKQLLASWGEKMQSPQDELLESLVSCLPDSGEVSAEVRCQLASAVREHYRKHPDALQLQASGNVVPPTVQNHR